MNRKFHAYQIPVHANKSFRDGVPRNKFIESVSIRMLTIAFFVLFGSLVPVRGQQNPTYISEISIRAVADHTSIKIRDGKLWFEHGDFGAPSRVFIVGKSYKLKSNKGSTKNDPFTDFGGTLKPFDKAAPMVKVVRGRGTVEIGEMPSLANQWTLTIRVVDLPNDSGDYSFKIKW